MGISHFRTVDGPAVLALWEIRESAGELLEGLRLSPAEKQLYDTFRTGSRQLQWLAYRRLIRDLISPERYPVVYDESGKPFLAGSSRHISVTHTGDWAGVIISSRVRVGIDMERIRPRIERVKEKFLSEVELSFISAESFLEDLTLSWCAKEALYKLYGQRNLDFRENLRVHLPADPADGSFQGEVIMGEKREAYRLHHLKQGDLFVVWVAESRKEHAPE